MFQSKCFYTTCHIHTFTHIHTVMTEATTQAANLLIRSNLVSYQMTHRHVDWRRQESTTTTHYKINKTYTCSLIALRVKKMKMS